MTRLHVLVTAIGLRASLAAAIALFSSASGAEPRTALVIGNAGYADAPLRNPLNDATDMAAKLRQLQFEVILEVDLDRPGLRRSIRQFESRLSKKGGVGLFYYAGHGVQVNGRNYLIPLDADIERAYEVEDEAVDARSVLAAMEQAENDVNIVILDACRNNPFRSFRSLSRGLAQMEGPTGSLIAYSTAPGRVAADGKGRNSPYVTHLLRHMGVEGLPIEQMFKRVRQSIKRELNDTQIPWETSSLTGDFQFVPGGNPPIPVASSPAERRPADREVELAFWDSIKDSDDPKMFDAYLQRYPEGEFAALAKLARDRSRDAGGVAASDQPGNLVDPSIVGTWAIDVPGPGGVSHWVQTINANGTFDFSATGPGSPPVQHGSFKAGAGIWQIHSPLINWVDGGSYELLTPDTLLLNGKLGPAVWKRKR